MVKKTIPSTHTRYLGIIVDEHFSWNQNLKMQKKKLSRANGPSAKAQYYPSPKFLRTLYFAIFESHFRYGGQMQGQKKKSRYCWH